MKRSREKRFNFIIAEDRLRLSTVLLGIGNIKSFGIDLAVF